MALPWLQDFTGGKFLERIRDTDLTGRDALMERDLELWSANAFLGVGPGRSKLTDAETGNFSLAHTEFTRLIAEHGVLGALAFLLLLGMSCRAVTRARGGVPRGLAAGLQAWALLFMIHSAMRLAAPSFLFGLGAGMAMLSLDGPPEASDPERDRPVAPARPLRAAAAHGVLSR